MFILGHSMIDDLLRILDFVVWCSLDQFVLLMRQNGNVVQHCNILI